MADTAPITPSDTKPAGVNETLPGLFDKPFAVITGAVAAVLMVLVVVGCVGVARALRLDDAPDTRAVATRAAATVAVAGLGFGGVLLVIGGWLGALETRGRLTLVLTKTTVTTTHADGTTEEKRVEAAASGLGGEQLASTVVEGIKAIGGELRTMRATVAILFAGLLIVLGALGSVAYVAHAPNTTPTTVAPTDRGGSPS